MSEHSSTLRKIWSLRHFWLTLAKHDIKDRYRRSLLGIAWSLLKPAAMTLILAVVFTNVFDVAVSEYVPFLFLGIVTWQFLTESLLQGCNAFRLGSTYLRVRPIPLAIFPLRVVLSAATHASLGLAAGALILVCLHGPGHLAVIPALLPALALLMLTAWSLACLAAILHTFYSDTQQIAEILLQVVFYATPVIYLPETVHKTGWLHVVIECNPFAAFLELVRRPLLHGDAPDSQAVVIAAGFTSVVVGVAVWLLRRVEKRLILWL